MINKVGQGRDLLVLFFLLLFVFNLHGIGGDGLEIILGLRELGLEFLFLLLELGNLLGRRLPDLSDFELHVSSYLLFLRALALDF